MSNTIRPKDRDTLLQALRAGVVPRTGQHLIQVGRASEIASLIKDIERVADRGTAFRLVVGEYGAGKTFFLNLVRAIAMEKKLVTMHADLNPDRRLQGSAGEARSLYAELVKSMSTRTKPDGAALSAVVERFVTQAKDEGKATGKPVEDVIKAKLESISEMVNGYDFADVIKAYYRGFEQGNDQLKNDAVRWLRGEFNTKTEARQALGVRVIVDDDSVYDQIKLLARFVSLAGYAGLLVCIDEAVNLYKLNHAQARNSNYEQVLRMLNDALQGSAESLGLIIGATPETLTDPRRGLYSYAALQSRLAENSFAAKAGIQDFTGPVLRLASLTNEDFFVLLQKLRDVHAYNDPAKRLVDDEGIVAFMKHAAQKLGETYFRTPRTTITSFLALLATLEQKPGAHWRELLDGVQIQEDTGGASDAAPDESIAIAPPRSTASAPAAPRTGSDDLESFKI